MLVLVLVVSLPVALTVREEQTTVLILFPLVGALEAPIILCLILPLRRQKANDVCVWVSLRHCVLN